MSRAALVPELYVSNLATSLDFYVGLLGFRVEYERPEERFAALSLDAAQLMLEEAPSLQRATAEEFEGGQWRTADLEQPFGRGVNLEIEVAGLRSIEARVTERGYPLLLEAHDRTYRTGAESRRVRQLLIADPDGYLVRLSEPAPMWHSREPEPGIMLRRTTPILRIFDVGKAKEFYVDFLGFSVDWEHRFDENAPAYLQVSRGDCILHLSEHHGDATPGSRTIVETEGIDAFHSELSARGYKFYRPSVEQTEWGTREMGVIDPFGNRLTFAEARE